MKRAWIGIGTFGLVAALACAGLTIAQQRAKQAPAPKLPQGVQVERDVPYIEGGHERNRLDLYLPEKAAGIRPLVVWIHGGGWQAGSKDNCPGVSMVTRGYVVASINYRLSQHAIFPAQIEDCKAAIRWLRAHADKYHIDRDRIGVWGGSAGGHLVALLGTTGGVKDLEGTGGHLDQSSRVQCVIDLFSPTDFVGWDPDFNKAVYTMIDHLLGGSAQENKDQARRASPLNYVSKDAAPILILHGDQDKLVPLSQSEVFAEALKKADADVTLQVIQGAGHGGPGFTSPDTLKLIDDFFTKHLNPTKQ